MRNARMKGMAFLMLTVAILHGDASAQPQTLDDAHQRIAALEREVEQHKLIARRNGILAGAFVIGLTVFGLYRRRVESARLTERLGMTDSLTGLRNRRYVTQTIAADCTVAARQYRTAASAGQRTPENSDLLFVLIDIDNFKAVNERYGQDAGDRVLAQIADVLKATCRASDTIARWDGEEFLVVLRFTNRETAPISAERIRMAIEQRVLDLGDGRNAGCTCSIGFAPYPVSPELPEDSTWEHAIALADEALQQAKQTGGNTWAGAYTPPARRHTKAG
jgi:diguanylate cyclase (GGDEF)-like protein